MSEDSQIVVPRSFIELHMRPGALRPSLPREELVARYELCEDLAQALVEQARDRLFELGVAESDVLERIRDGLDAGGVTGARETWWVLRRLAELLDWPPLPDAPA